MNSLVAKETQKLHIVYTLSGKERTGKERIVKIPLNATVVTKGGIYASPKDVPIGEEIQTYGVDILPPIAKIRRVC